MGSPPPFSLVFLCPPLVLAPFPSVSCPSYLPFCLAMQMEGDLQNDNARHPPSTTQCEIPYKKLTFEEKPKK